MKDRSQYPLAFVISESKLKIHMTLSDTNDCFALYVNSMNYLKLPFKYDMTLEGDKDVKF